MHHCCGLCSVEIANVSVVSGTDVLIDNINLMFHCGELTALIGKNGAGKTTLLRAILGERAYKGRITFLDDHGKRIQTPKIGYVPQSLDFDKSMPLTVADFVAAATGRRPLWLGQGKEQKASIRTALDEMECGHLLDRQLGALSGGELQRVLLALAYNQKPDLLILDEPVSGIDQAGMTLFYDKVLAMRDGNHMAILLVSHDLPLIRRYADQVVLLDKTIMAHGKAEEVFQADAFQDAFGFGE